jgi:signal transduction histidine kinase
VSALDHGADPSGETDSAPALRAAIAAAGAAGGGVVHLPAGLYRLDSPIEITVSGIVLAGDGPETQLWFPTPTGAGFRSQISFQGALAPGPRHALRADGAAFDVVLQVEDTGPGIPPAERDAVFRPFYRALGTQVDGSGLGLAIVLEIAQRYGASITLADARPRHAGPAAPPPGALFSVRFPLATTGSSPSSA